MIITDILVILAFVISGFILYGNDHTGEAIACGICAVGILIFSIYMGVNGAQFGYSHSSEPRCVICGKTGATQITNTAGDENYYCPEHYSNAWQHYYGK